MAMVVNHNIPALSTYNVINSTSNALQKSINKLSTGLRINSAADDAAGLAISEKMRAQVRGLDQAVANSQDGISMIQTAEGALSETHSILQRMRELSVQAANDTLTQQDRGYIQEEVDQLREEITRIGNTTQFNKKKLLNGDAAVLWSSDDSETKAIINGGLRTIDQFGQKSSAEGNYKISIKATAGQGEVQKTDLFKLKHNATPGYSVEGSNNYDGAALNANDGSIEPDFKAVGKRAFSIAMGGTSATISLTNKSFTSVKGLADEIQKQLNTTAKMSSSYVTVGVSDDGKHLTITTKGLSGAITFTDKTTSAGTPGGEADDIQQLFGMSKGALEKAVTYTTTGGNSMATPNTVTLVAGSISLVIDGDSSSIKLTTVAGNSSAEAIRQQLQDKIDANAKYAGKVTVNLVDGSGANAKKFEIVSTAGPVNVKGTAGNLANLGLTTANNVLTSSVEAGETEELDFNKQIAGSSFKIQVGLAGSGASTTVSISKTAASVQDVVDDINKALTDAGITNASARVVKDADGHETVRIFANGSTDSAAKIVVSDALSSGTVDAIFGDGTMKRLGSSVGAAGGSSSVKTGAEGVGGIEDVAPYITQTTFKIMSEDGKETLATITLDGGYKTDEDSTAAEKLVQDLNAKLEAAGLKDFKAELIEDGSTELDDKAKYDDPMQKDVMKKLRLSSGTRDFKLEADEKNAKSVQQIFGNNTKVDAEEVKDNPVGTIGLVANDTTSLRDIDKFWDSEGNFLLEDPQTLTLTQGDGKQATVTLYQYDTVGSMAEKINNAIANDLGQAQYLDKSASNYDTAVNSFATFVANDPAEDDDPNSESVKGTMLIRSINPGSTGTISFSGNEALINALSLNTVQQAKESQYEVTVENAHTGKTVVDGAKITGNKLVGALHENVDVEFDAMAGIKATWDDENNQFKFTDSTTDPKAPAYTTYLHLSDNTTVFQIGANEGEDMGINIGDMRSHALGLDEVNVTTRDRASRSITVIDNAIDKVSMQRSKLGAYQNRLEHTINNLTTASENLTAAESRIRDTDMAKEMMNFSKLQIMLQAGNSMLAQANQLPQNVLSLVR